MKGERLNVGLAGLYFSNFEAEKFDVYPESVKALESLAAVLDFNLVAYPGLIGDGTEAEAANAFFIENEVDFLLLQSSSLIMGDVIPPFEANSFRLGFWMVPEPETGGELQLNSMTGFNLGVSILRKHQPERKIKWFYGEGGSGSFRKRFRITVRALTALKRLDGSSIAVADEAVPGFANLTYDSAALKNRLGLETGSLPLETLFREVRADLADSASGAEDVRLVMIESSSSLEVPESELKESAATASALKRVGAENGFQAAALKCWPEFQDEFHMAPCLAVSYLNDCGMITSCEGDVPGAVSMLTAYYINGEAPTMNDPVALLPEEDLLQMWHCGPGPASWADEDGRSIGWHHTLNRRVGGNERKYGLSSDLSFAEGPVTMLRISGDGSEIFILEGEVVKKAGKAYCGSGGWIGNLRTKGEHCGVERLLEAITAYGLDHHYPIMRGHWEEVLREMAAWAGMKVLELPESTDYVG